MKKPLLCLLFACIVAAGSFAIVSLVNRLPLVTLRDITEAEPVMDTSNWLVCDNPVAGYMFSFPPSWYIYGAGAYDTESPAIVGTSTCAGTGVTVSSNPPSDLQRPDEQGFSVRADPEQTIATAPYLQAAISSLAKDSDVSPQIILEAYVGTSSAKWINIDGVSFAIGGTKIPILAGIYDNSLYTIFPSEQLNLKTFETILSTFKFTNQ